MEVIWATRGRTPNKAQYFPKYARILFHHLKQKHTIGLNLRALSFIQDQTEYNKHWKCASVKKTKRTANRDGESTAKDCVFKIQVPFSHAAECYCACTDPSSTTLEHWNVSDACSVGSLAVGVYLWLYSHFIDTFVLQLQTVVKTATPKEITDKTLVV